MEELAREEALADEDVQPAARRRRLSVEDSLAAGAQPLGERNIVVAIPPLTEVSRHCLLSRKAASERASLGVTALERYVVGVGKESFERAAGDTPCLRERRAEFQPSPSVGFQSLSWRPGRVRDRVVAAMGLPTRGVAHARHCVERGRHCFAAFSRTTVCGSIGGQPRLNDEFSTRPADACAIPVVGNWPLS